MISGFRRQQPEIHAVETNAIQITKIRVAALAPAAREIDDPASLIHIDDIAHQPLTLRNTVEQPPRAQIVPIQMPLERRAGSATSKRVVGLSVAASITTSS